MLHSLHIENIAVIKSVDLDFSSGFMVLSGETGAGKSIIIDSINLLLGAKADREMIRHGENTAMVSALFTDLSEMTKRQCADIGVDFSDDEGLFVQRTISADGRSHIRLNGRTVNLSVLKTIAPSLVSIHGQSDTGELMDSERHIEIVDLYASNGELLDEYRTAYAALEKTRRDIQEITKKEAERERLKEILEYQIKDIDALKLHDGEEEELLEKKVKIKNSEKITKNSEYVYKALRGAEKSSVAYLLDKSTSALMQLAGVIPEYSEYADTLREALALVEDVAEEVYTVLDEADMDPTSVLNEIESRLDKITKIKRKYGLTIADVLTFRDNAKQELDTLENAEELLIELEHKEKEQYLHALGMAEHLHELRKHYADTLSAKVCEILEFLDMPNTVFYARMTSDCKDGIFELNKDGYDKLEFYISANKGADAQSLSKIASGGELARVMLALKSIIADKDGVSTVVFDEIDAGVSGKTARKIGFKMLDMSSQLQIFCVTHSAQIASLGDIHFLIEKHEVGAATETSVSALDYNGRVKELSRILGGINVTEAQRAAALDMLNKKELA